MRRTTAVTWRMPVLVPPGEAPFMTRAGFSVWWGGEGGQVGSSAPGRVVPSGLPRQEAGPRAPWLTRFWQARGCDSRWLLGALARASSESRQRFSPGGTIQGVTVVWFVRRGRRFVSACLLNSRAREELARVGAEVRNRSDGCWVRREDCGLVGGVTGRGGPGQVGQPILGRPKSVFSVPI